MVTQHGCHLPEQDLMAQPAVLCGSLYFSQRVLLGASSTVARGTQLLRIAIVAAIRTGTRMGLPSVGWIVRLLLFSGQSACQSRASVI